MNKLATRKKRLKWEHVDMHILDNDVQYYMFNRLSEKTRKNWGYSVSHWMDWCKLYDLSPTTANERKICRYTAYRFRQHDIGSSHARSEMYGVRDLFLRDLDQYLNLTQVAMPRWHAMLKGRDVEKPPGKDASVFVTSEILSEMFDSPALVKSDYDNQVFRLCFALLHNTVRRSDELMRSCLTKLECQNIVFDNNPSITHPTAGVQSAIFLFHFSKKNKTGKLQSAPLYHWCKKGYICAMCELLALWRWRPHLWKATSPLLQFKNKAMISYPALRKKWIDLCKLCGYDHSIYKLHGFRGGGNFDLKKLGVADTDRCKMAGWSSERSMFVYDLKMQPQQLHESVAQMCGFNVTNFSTKAFDALLAQRERDIALRNARNCKTIAILSFKQLKKQSRKKKRKKLPAKIKVNSPLHSYPLRSRMRKQL